MPSILKTSYSLVSGSTPSTSLKLVPDSMTSSRMGLLFIRSVNFSRRSGVFNILSQFRIIVAQLLIMSCVSCLGGEKEEDESESKAISLVFLRRMPLLPYVSHFRLSLSISNEAAKFFLNEGDTDEKVVQLLKVLKLLLLELLLLFSLNDF